MSYGQAITPPATKVDTLQNAIIDFDPALDRMQAIAERLLKCADRITGSRPAEVSENKDTPEPQHLLSLIQSRRRRLVMLLDGIEGEVARMEGAL